MKRNFRKITAMLLSFVIFISAFIGITPVNVIASENGFGYVMYATAYEESAITVEASNACINGGLMTNGTVEITGNNNHNGKVKISENDYYYFIYDNISENYFSAEYDSYEEDKSISDNNININKSAVVYGELSLKGNVNINASIQAMSDVNITGETLNANNAVIMSKYGDINITSNNVSVTGLIYAPFGIVNIDSSNCNLNNVIIIANQINIKCNNLNANYNTNIGNVIGNESEDFYCDENDWKYLKDTDRDGLNDYYESYYSFTYYLSPDTDNNGVLDYDEDYDYDTLTNGEELNYKTEPLNYDTDEDGITDDKEMFNQKYVLDNENYIIEQVVVEMNCTGNINSTTYVEDMLNVDVIASRVPGLVGSPYEITTESKCNRITAAMNYVNAKGRNDKISVVLFDSAAKAVVSMEKNKNTIKEKL